MKLHILRHSDGREGYVSPGVSLILNGKPLEPVDEVTLGDDDALRLIHYPNTHRLVKLPGGLWTIQSKDSSQKGKPA